MSKVVFTPVSVVSGLLAGLIASRLFEFIWGRIDGEEAPEPEHRTVTWPKLLLATGLQGAIFAATRGAVSHATRVAFARSTGVWPGDEEPDSR